MLNGRIDLNARDYKNSTFMYINAILGFIIIYCVSNIIKIIKIINKLIAFLGKNSIYILAYHMPSNIITYNIIIPLLPINFSKILNTNNFISVTFFVICGILFSLFMMCIHKSICKKYLYVK